MRLFTWLILICIVVIGPGYAQTGSKWPPYAVFNVMDCGATGNGTTDDTAAIQACETAAEAVVTGNAAAHGARVIFPQGTYYIHNGPITINQDNIVWQGVGGLSGQGTVASNGASGAFLFSDVASNAIVSVTSHGGGLSQFGPGFFDLGFGGTGLGSRSAIGISINNSMQGRIKQSAFLSLGTGITFVGATDDSNWVVDSNNFRDNVIGISSGTGGGADDNVFINNYIFPTTVNDIGIYIGANAGGGYAGGITIAFNHIACNLTYPIYGVLSETGVNADIALYGNFFETCSPAFAARAGAHGSANQRGNRLVGNVFTGTTYNTGAVTTTCTPTNTSTTLACPTITGIAAGMVVQGTGLPLNGTYGSGATGTLGGAGTLDGMNTVVSAAGTSVVMTNPATSSPGSESVNFCYPLLSWGLRASPTSYANNVVVQGNAYSSWNCVNNSGYDGG